MKTKRTNSFDTDRLLRQEPYLRRSLSVSSVLLAITGLPVVLVLISFVMFVICSFGHSTPGPFLASRFESMVSFFRDKHPAILFMAALSFAWFLDCRLKLQHIETIKRLNTQEGAQQENA